MTRTRLSLLWKYQVRYRLARRLIHVGLFVMPEGRYKTNLMNALWDLYDAVATATAAPGLVVVGNAKGDRDV